MTLIVAITTPYVSIHASDRRVTMIGSNAVPRIYSPVENKTIVLLIEDAVVTIGFTGIAHVGTEPTDQWIAKMIAPKRPGHLEMGSFAFGGPVLGRVKLHTIIWRLKVALEQLPWQHRKYGLIVQIAGYRQRRNRCIPFTVELEWKGGAVKIDGWMRLPRTRSQRTIVSQIGDGWPISRTAKIIFDHAEASGRRDAEAIRLATVSAIRERSAEARTVGSDLMTVVIPNPMISREIIWRFEPSAPHFAALVGPNVNRAFQAVYSPWIMTPSSIASPSLGTGGMRITHGSFTIRCNEPEHSIDSGQEARGPRIVFASSHQRRLPPPNS